MNAATPATNSGGASPGESAGAAESQARADLASCNGLASTANRCCNSPSACVNSMQTSDKQSFVRLLQAQNAGPVDGQSMSDYCAQIKQLESDAGNVSAGLGSICTVNQSSCQQSCSALADRYQGLLSSCGENCAAAGVYRETLAELNAKAQSCNSLRVPADQLSARGISSGRAQGAAASCAQNANSADAGSIVSSLVGAARSAASRLTGPNSAQPHAGLPLANFNSDSSTAAATAVPASCAQTPDSPACRAMASASSPALGKTSFSQVTKPQAADNFNTAGVLDTATGAPVLPSIEPQASGKNAVVPNNSGGSIPGAGEGSGKATLGSGAKQNLATIAAAGNTDILQGTRSGSGYSSGSATNDSPGLNSEGDRRNVGLAKGSSFQSVDLKKYLPGGSLDPGRHMAGIGPASLEIHGQGADLFKRISNKMTEKCKLGVLWECY